MSRNGRERRHGRIRPHERDTNDVQLLGDNMAVQEADRVAVRETETQQINLQIWKEYMNCINHIIEYLRVEYPAYYNVGVVELTEEQKTDLDLFS